jgi:ubiquinone/menaquinone biosynthesis C-methylase UbiE
MYSRIKFHIVNRGFKSFFIIFASKIYEYLFPPKLSFFNKSLDIFRNSVCLEIGGPSSIFQEKGEFPVYPHALRVDNINFSTITIWNKLQKKFINTKNGKSLGNQIISEASNLNSIKNNQYDFLISSEMIQHLANPILGLEEWNRVLCERGHILIIVPYFKKTFDHKRPVTTFKHLLEDYENKTSEEDLTHLEEILALHDLSKDRLAGDFEDFKKRSINNFEFRALHQHVFDEKLFIQLVNHAKFNILEIEFFRNNIILLAQKASDSNLDNSKYLSHNYKTKLCKPNLFH